MITALVAVAEVGDKLVIADANGDMPWDCKADLRLFKRRTENNTVIMGRRTYEKIGRPLPNRRNVILSSSLQCTDKVEVVSSLDQISLSLGEKVFIVGGAQVYLATLHKIDKFIITYIKKKHWAKGLEQNINGCTILPFNSFSMEMAGLRHVRTCEHEDFYEMTYSRTEI